MSTSRIVLLLMLSGTGGCATSLHPEAPHLKEAGADTSAIGTPRDSPDARLIFCFSGMSFDASRVAAPYYAIAAVEIDNPKSERGATIAKFEFYLENLDFKPSQFTRILDVKVVNKKPKEPFVGYCEQVDEYMKPWRGDLPRGKVQLYIKAALESFPPAGAGRCRLAVGSHAIDGPASGSLP